MGGGQFCAKMSDGEVETPVEAPAPAVGEPLDLMSALQMVLKKSMACHSLLRGLHEVARTIEKGEAQLVVLARIATTETTSSLSRACARRSPSPSSRFQRRSSPESGVDCARLTRRATPPRSSSAPAPPSGTTERRPRDSPSSWSTSRALRAHGPAAALGTLRTFDMGVGGPRPSTLFPAKPEPKKLKNDVTERACRALLF